MVQTHQINSVLLNWPIKIRIQELPRHHLMRPNFQRTGQHVQRYNLGEGIAQVQGAIVRKK